MHHAEWCMTATALRRVLSLFWHDEIHQWRCNKWLSHIETLYSYTLWACRKIREDCFLPGGTLGKTNTSPDTTPRPEVATVVDWGAGLGAGTGTGDDSSGSLVFSAAAAVLGAAFSAASSVLQRRPFWHHPSPQWSKRERRRLLKIILCRFGSKSLGRSMLGSHRPFRHWQPWEPCAWLSFKKWRQSPENCVASSRAHGFTVSHRLLDCNAQSCFEIEHKRWSVMRWWAACCMI